MIPRAVLRKLWKRCDAAAGAEFALVLPVLILFLLGIIDVGRYMWSINQLEKASQMGARMAVVTDMVPSDLAAANFAISLGQGVQIPTSSFGELQCDKANGNLTCTCVSNCTGIGMTADAAAFDRIAARMKAIAGAINDTNVQITYKNSGLGYSGDPNGPDVAPIVTVSAVDVNFVPLIFQFLGGSVKLPTESASLTLEDSSGLTSN